MAKKGQKEQAQPAEVAPKAEVSKPVELSKSDEVALKEKEIYDNIEQSQKEQEQERKLFEEAVARQIAANEKAELDKLKNFSEGVDLVKEKAEADAPVGVSDNAPSNVNDVNPGDQKTAEEFEKKKEDGTVDNNFAPTV